MGSIWNWGIPDRLLRILRSLLTLLSHRVPLWGYDEPQTLPYAIRSICPVDPDGEQFEKFHAACGFESQCLDDGEYRQRRRDDLKYVNNCDPGIARKVVGERFAYVLPFGRFVKDTRTKAPVKKLAVPPAWSDV